MGSIAGKCNQGDFHLLNFSRHPRLSLYSHLLPLRLERTENLRPKLARLTKRVRQVDVCHARIRRIRHAFELRNEILQPESLTDDLCSISFELDVRDVDVEVVVRRLI